MATPASLRAFALSLPEVEEKPHWERTSFRVRGKIMLTMAENEGIAVLKIPASDLSERFEQQPDAFAEIKWGKTSWTQVTLNLLTQEELNDYIFRCWQEVAPKKLVREFELGG